MSNRLRTLRERARLTQGELAKLLDADGSEVSRWERGDRFPNPQIIERLAKIFKVGSWQLFISPEGYRADIRQSEDKPIEEARGDSSRGGAL